MQSTSLTSQVSDAFVRADSFMHHEANDLEAMEDEEVVRTLRTFENLIDYGSDCESDSVSDLNSWPMSALHFMVDAD